ncbi:MAG: squalene synthase HpnC [Isosphaeraceae bacterium]
MIDNASTTENSQPPIRKPQFLEDLRRFGPETATATTLDEALIYCARLTASHYENFSVVTRLTPRPLRPAFSAVYSFCRWSDDLGDEVGDPERSRELLAWWRGELRAMYQGQARHPVYLALGETVREFGIPIEPFEALISAFEQDQDLTDYPSFDQLLDYCTRSANPVGHLVLYLGRVFNDENARLSDSTCTALQLANMWQDVARDLAIDRIYLPGDDRDRFGVTEDDLRALRFTPRFRALMEFEVSRVRAMFHQGWPLVFRMPRPLAVDVDLFTRGGLAILDRIERQGYDVLKARPALSKTAKAGLLLRSVLRPGPPRGRTFPARPPGKKPQVSAQRGPHS